MSYKIDQDACLISIINNPKSYKDRCIMLAQVGDQDLKHVVFVNGYVKKRKEYCEIVYPENPFTNALKFWLWSYNQVSDLVSCNKGVKFIVHEHSVGMVCCLIKLKLNSNSVLRVCSLYSGEVAFFIGRGWRVDPNGRGYLGFKQRLRIISSRFKPLIYRIVSVWSAEVLVGNSKESANELKTILKGRERSILNTCVVLNAPDLIESSRVDEYSCQRHEFSLLYVGKIYPAKGIGTLLSAFSILLRNHREINYKLTIVGRLSNNDQAWFTALLAGYGVGDKVNLVLPVPQSELSNFYSESDLLVLPSFFEGSPRVMKEAMAAGLPAICSRISGTKVVDPNEEVSIFFLPGDAQQLALKIRHISLDRRQLLYRRSKGLIRAAEFSPEVIAKKRTEFAKNLLIKKFNVNFNSVGYKR